MEKSRILFAEDDRSSNFFIKQFLENKNFEVEACTDGEQAIKLSRKLNFDLAIIDLFLPKFNGITVLRRIRDRVNNCPVIVMTDTHCEANEIETYKSGANLIHTKPINFNILEAQINSLIKSNKDEYFIELGDMYLNFKNRLCIKNQKDIYLTFNEFSLAYLFFSNRHKIFTRAEIQSRILDEDSGSTAVDTLVSRLRCKLGKYKGESVVQTVIKSGFRLNPLYLESENI